MIRRHLKLFLLALAEVLFLLMMIVVSVGDAAIISFCPLDFADNVRGRANISVDDDGVSFVYDDSLVLYDDEGRALGEDLLTGKFAIGSGAYKVTVDYDSDGRNGYVELFSENWVTETVSVKINLENGRDRASAVVYIPFGRSMHDIQMNIHYNGPGDLKVFSIRMEEQIQYRWVPVAGYLLFFIVLDSLIWILFARSGKRTIRWIREHYEVPILFFVVFLASLPDMADFIYAGHDLNFHLARIIAVSHEISYGQFPVRMLTDMLQGYGYPTSTFYCDLFMYPVALLYLFGVPLRMCWQIYVLLINAATAVLSYFSFCKISGRRDVGIVGALIYTLSAYRIVDVYLRCAMGEFTALTFIPLILLGIWLIYYEEDKKNEGWLYLGLGMTAVSLSHLLSLEMISLFLIIFCLLEFRKTFTKRTLLSIGKAALMTVLLSGWFIFPMLMSMRDIGISMYEHQTFIQAEGAYPSQVFNFFMRGTGYSTAGTPAEMPLSIGGGMIAGIAFLIYAVMKQRSGDKSRQRTALVLVILSLAFSMYFFPWDSIAGVAEGRFDVVSRLARMVQYPWRFLEITTAVLSLAVVCLLRHLKVNSEEGVSLRLWTGILILGTLLSLGAFYDPFINEADITRAADEYYMDKSIGREEYFPTGAGRLMDLSQEVETESNVEVSAYESAKGERLLTLSNNGDASSVLIPVFAYPGYQAEDLDTKNSIAFTSGDNARIRLEIPGGYSGTIRIYYKEPVLWRIFEIISLLSAVAFIVLILRRGL